MEKILAELLDAVIYLIDCEKEGHPVRYQELCSIKERLEGLRDGSSD